MLLASLVTVGIIACFRMPLKFLPEMDFPFVGCFIPYPGATPEQVEKEVAVPAEGEFRTIPGLKRISSTSNSDGCRINMRFESGVNMSTASAEVRDRVERLKLTLPKDVDKVLIFRHNSSSIPIMAVGLFRGGDEEEFIHLVRTVVQPRLARLEGVAELQIFASKPEPEVLIEFDQNKLRNYGIPLYAVITKLQTANLNLPVGNLLDGNAKFYVRVTDEFHRPEQLAEIVIADSGIRLKDVATVGFRTRELEAHFDIDNKGGAFILVRKESEANTVQTCANVRAEIEKIKTDPIFAGTEEHIFFDQSELIMTALNGLVDAGEGGGIMAIIVLYFFLLKFRPTIVVALAIPVSLVTALGFMYFAGMTLNLVTMVSLIVAVGMLVDDAIVVIENVYRYRQQGKSPEESAARGTTEVGIAVTASTLTTIVVFIPVFYMQSGEMSAYMRQFAVPMCAALMASLLVAFTLIPMSTSRMRDVSLLNLFSPDSGKDDASPREERRRGFTGWLRRMFSVHPITRVIRVYANCIDLVLRNRLASIVAIMAVIALTIAWPMRNVGMQDMPKLDLHQVNVDVELDQNFDMAMANQTFSLIKDSISKQEEELGVKNLFTHYDASGGTIEVFLKKVEDYAAGTEPRYSTEDVMNILWQRLPERVPGVRIRLSMPEANSGEGEKAMSVSVRLTGDDADTLSDLAERFRLLMGQIPNISDCQVNQERVKQEVQLRVDGARADNAGISPMIIARTVDVALRGNRLPYLKQGGREFPVWAQFREEDRKSKANLDNVSVIGSAGTLVPLDQLVSFGKAESPTSIYRVDGKNVIQVSGKISTDNLSKVQTDLNRAIASMGLPLGYTVDLGDEFRELNTNVANFVTTLAMALILIYIVMAALFESLVLPLSILTSVPLAFIGVYWGMFLTNTALDTIGLIGCILMAGVVVKNGIVIVDHINLLRREGMPRHAAVVQAGRDRFRPVLMTALTTTLGVVPLAIESKSGSTVSFVSLGRAFCSGLVSGTVLTLIIVPLFYTIIEDLADWVFGFVGDLASLGSHEEQPLDSADADAQ